MFWVPKGWVPYYAEWLLSFPRAPLGSISIQAWALACGAIILLVNDALVAIVGLVLGFTASTKTSETKTKTKEVPFTSEKQAAGVSDEKKEL